MPLHRVPKDSGRHLDVLEARVAEIEQAGESVLQVIPTANDWLIVTAKPGRGEWETRA